jgi:RNA polymerase sigma-70 factor (ECF subfamily)
MDTRDHEAEYLRLLAAYGPAVTRLTRAYEREADRAEDLAQDVWLALWRALPLFRGESSERTFVFRVAHNRAVSHVMRWRRRATRPIDEAADVRDARRTPEQEVTARQRHERLREALSRLPLGQRQAMLLVLEGCSHADAADVLGVNENTVSARVTRARRALRQDLAQEAER